MNTHSSVTPASAWAEQDSHRLVVEDLTEVICRFLANGTFTFVNEAYCRFFGKQHKDLLGKSWHPVAVSEDLPLIHAKLATLSPENPVVTIENRVYDHAGEVRWMQFSNRAFFDAQGNLVETQAVGRDITERVQAEQKLQESQQRWQFAMESSGFGVWDWDIANDHFFYSSQWKAILGYASDEKLPERRTDFEAMLHPDDRPRVLNEVREHLTGRTTDFSHEFRLLCKDHSWKWVICRGRVIARSKGDCAPQRMIGTMVDISTRKEAEDREAQSLALVAGGAAAAEVLEAIVLNIEAAFPGMHCSIMLVDNQGKQLRLKVAPRLPHLVRKKIRSLDINVEGCCTAVTAATRQRVICKDIMADTRMTPFRQMAKEAHLQSCWSEPILGTSGSVLGALTCYWGKPHEPPQEEIIRVSNAARLAAFAIEREEQDHILRANEERYARTLSGTTDGLWDWNVETGEMYFSSRWKQLLGFPEDESNTVCEAWFRKHLHPEDIPMLVAARIEHFEKRVPYAVEFRMRTKRGKFRWFAAYGQAEWGHEGKAIRMTGTLSDIHERKEAEQKYLRELAYNKALLDHISTFIVVMDTTARFVHANAAFYSIMGYQESEIMGRTPWEVGFLNAKDQQKSQHRFARLLRGEDNPPIDVKLRTRDGTWRMVELRSTSTRKRDGSADRIIITANDITERERLQRELLRVVEEEQTRIGHDLHDGVGQTMTGILVLMEALESGLKGQHKMEAARIHELMQESVAEVRRMSHGLSPASVKYRGLAGALQLLAETVRTNFRTPCECAVDASVIVENEDKQAHLFRIAQEAVNNALRHGKPGKVNISLRRFAGDECELVIEDDGLGLKKLAKPTQSSGIGMQVMQHRAQLIGARLQIKARGKLKRGVMVSCRFESVLQQQAPKQRKR